MNNFDSAQAGSFAISSAADPDFGERKHPSQHSTSASEVLSAASSSAKQPPATAELFDLRQTVMRYTNPLRAKILLFSLLHHRYQADQVEQAFLLKSYELDKLLIRTLQAYEELPILTAQLRKMSQLLEPQTEYTQAAAAILRAVKPFYRAAVSQTVAQPIAPGKE